MNSIFNKADNNLSHSKNISFSDYFPTYGY